MTRRDLLALMGVGAGALTLAGCGEKSSRYRQKITVVVDTPNGVRTGSSVIEVGYAEKPAWAQSFGGNGFWARGEAVVVDIAPGKTLYATLAPMSSPESDIAWYQSWLIISALHAGVKSKPPIHLDKHDFSIAAHHEIGNLQLKIILPQSLYPIFITFADPGDPNSLINVNPGNLVVNYGTGYSLRSIIVEVTDERVTSELEKRLKWLDHLDRYRSDYSNPFTGTLPNEIGYLRIAAR